MTKYHPVTKEELETIIKNTFDNDYIQDLLETISHRSISTVNEQCKTCKFEGKHSSCTADLNVIEHNAEKKERERVLDELKTDLKTRIIASSGNQWAKGRNSGLIECCNIIEESLRTPKEQP